MKLSLYSMAILWIFGSQVWGLGQWDLPEADRKTPWTNHFQLGIGFDYRNVYRGAGFSDTYGIKGPSLYAFLKKDVFFIYGSLEGAWTWTDQSLELNVPELAGGLSLDKWRIRGGILHSRLGTPWQDEWRPKSEWDYRYEANATSFPIFLKFSLPGLEAVFHPNEQLSLGMGLYYWEFTSTDDPLFPQLTVDLRWQVGEFLAFQGGLSSWQHGRRASSDNPLLDRRTYHLRLSGELGPLTTDHLMDLYFYSEGFGRFSATHSLGIRKDFFNKHLHLRANLGLAGDNFYTDTAINGFADIHLSLNFKYFQLFVEEHLVQSLYNFSFPKHQLVVGAEFFFPW